ncbi:MAG: translocation/assembly module TamB domain-containing protein [Comamonadaceae bacterium]|nr:translocation/assembly module TamB domain-containing protein [Comamonadaceae bacterium]
MAFSGAPDNPRLDILALRPNLDVQRRRGRSPARALNPRVRLYSEPEMSDTDKLSWLVLGRASDGLGRADTALLQRAARGAAGRRRRGADRRAAAQPGHRRALGAPERRRRARDRRHAGQAARRAAGTWATSAASTRPPAPGS